VFCVFRGSYFVPNQEHAAVSDNHSAFFSADYDEKIQLSIPNYDIIQNEILDVVRALQPEPACWLETGCGTGTFVLKAAAAFPHATFAITDPSEGMLKIARDKVSGHPQITVLDAQATQDIALEGESMDVITAILCHHYLDPMTRRKATLNCFRMLRPGGLYITVENIKPETDHGIQIGLERWKNFQIRAGKTPQDAAWHVGRFGKEFFPLTIREHRNLMQDAGFKTREVFWSSYMQGAFYAVKEKV
jgi:tRNA (cmo5U34)-methyltransferase